MARDAYLPTFGSPLIGDIFMVNAPNDPPYDDLYSDYKPIAVDYEKAWQSALAYRETSKKLGQKYARANNMGDTVLADAYLRQRNLYSGFERGEIANAKLAWDHLSDADKEKLTAEGLDWGTLRSDAMRGREADNMDRNAISSIKRLVDDNMADALNEVADEAGRTEPEKTQVRGSRGQVRSSGGNRRDTPKAKPPSDPNTPRGTRPGKPKGTAAFDALEEPSAIAAAAIELLWQEVMGADAPSASLPGGAVRRSTAGRQLL